jgi:hypothetical protein
VIAWADVVALGQELPETEESTSYGRPALKVRGNRPDLVCTTPHYDGYPYLLVRLDAPLAEIGELVVDSWLLVAPKRLTKVFAKRLRF